ncbi:MAG: PHP domain-containing protein [Armatimonadetes bacterium]|nr:PHP domain-containing protein [Armatimonadota bacterium]
MAVDLHIHSTASDGTLTPEAIVCEAQRIGLSGIAVADHDALEGSQEAVGQGERLGLSVVPAVEISTDYEDVEVHVLGYWIDPHDAQLGERLRAIRDGRLLRAERIIDRLREIGVYQITLDDVLRAAAGGSVGRPHVATALVRAGVCRNLQEAFRRYLGKDAPGYVPRVRPTTAEAIRTVKEAGGCPVLAHPGLVPRRPQIIEQMADRGVEGVEAYHPKHDDRQVKTYIRRAAARGLLVTGGSDSHGPGGSDPVAIGAGGALDSCLEALVEWRRNRSR